MITKNCKPIPYNQNMNDFMANKFDYYREICYEMADWVFLQQDLLTAKPGVIDNGVAQLHVT